MTSNNITNIEFRKRINQHFSSNFVGSATTAASGKSSKEIAREAVQEEFRSSSSSKRSKRKQVDRHHGENDYLSSGDDDDGKKKQKNALNRKNKDDFDEIASTSTDKTAKAPAYRDRAKERREGQTMDYQDLSVLLPQPHPHPQQHIFPISRKEDGSASIGVKENAWSSMDLVDLDLDRIQQTALLEKYTTAKQQQQHATQVQQQQNPRELDLPTLFAKIQSSTCSAMGKGVFIHLQKLIQCQDKDKRGLQTMDDSKLLLPSSSSSVRTSFQKSRIFFNANIYHQNPIVSSWEIPKEIIMSRENDFLLIPHGSGAWKNKQGHGSTPMDIHWIQRIKSTFSELKSKQLRLSKSLKSSSLLSSKQQHIKVTSMDKDTATLKQEQGEKEEEDDDIFSGIGEYIASKPK